MFEILQPLASNLKDCGPFVYLQPLPLPVTQFFWSNNIFFSSTKCTSKLQKKTRVGKAEEEPSPKIVPGGHWTTYHPSKRHNWVTPT